MSQCSTAGVRLVKMYELKSNHQFYLFNCLTTKTHKYMRTRFCIKTQRR